MPSTFRRRPPGSDTADNFNTALHADVADQSGRKSSSVNSSPGPSTRENVKVLEQPPKARKRRNTFVFLLGSLFGIVAAGFFAKSNDLIDFPEIRELRMDSLFDVLPASLVRDMRDLVVRPTPCPSMICYL